MDLSNQPLLLTNGDHGEQCVYCGKDSWTCEHFEPPTYDAEDIEEWQRRSEEQGTNRNPAYICPNCADWIEILPSTNADDFNCPWCNERMRLDVDAEFEDGAWRDRSKIVTFRSHFDDKV